MSCGGSALKDCNVVKLYSASVSSLRCHFNFSTTNLLWLNGWKLEPDLTGYAKEMDKKNHEKNIHLQIIHNNHIFFCHKRQKMLTWSDIFLSSCAAEDMQNVI